jgi:hypothetical protein
MMAAKDSHKTAGATTKVCTTSPFENPGPQNQRVARREGMEIVDLRGEFAKSG